jgi:hypothetical protein
MGPTKDFTLTCFHAIAQLGHGTQLFGMWLEANEERFCLNCTPKLASEGIVDTFNAAALLPDLRMDPIKDVIHIPFKILQPNSLMGLEKIIPFISCICEN